MSDETEYDGMRCRDCERPFSKGPGGSTHRWVCVGDDCDSYQWTFSFDAPLCEVCGSGMAFHGTCPSYAELVAERDELRLVLSNQSKRLGGEVGG